MHNMAYVPMMYQQNATRVLPVGNLRVHLVCDVFGFVEEDRETVGLRGEDDSVLHHPLRCEALAGQ